MSVFTTVTPEQLKPWLSHYSLGELSSLEGIAAGIENTNYFLTTTHGRYVLTLFEKLSPRELPFYLGLMTHLAQHGIPCPQPLAANDGAYTRMLNGKPAAIVTRVPGKDLENVDAARCALMGSLLADMHVAGRSYKPALPNPRGPQWWSAALPAVLPFLDAQAGALLKAEIDHQSGPLRERLPAGVIHADLFRDNCLWDGERVGGVIDFYFAGVDALLYDVAITVNDWCMTPALTLDPARTQAMLTAYHRVRPFNDDERAAWPAMLRAGALRFWVSRLYDKHLPRAGELTHAKNPQHFQRILEHHIANESSLHGLFVK